MTGPCLHCEAIDPTWLYSADGNPADWSLWLARSLGWFFYGFEVLVFAAFLTWAVFKVLDGRAAASERRTVKGESE
jgi:hypothetical protein